MISISNLISEIQKTNLYLGQGDLREHLSYLSKVGILPKAVKRKIESGKIEGHYPDDIMVRLRQVSQLRTQGMTYAQMGKTNKLTNTLTIEATKEAVMKNNQDSTGTSPHELYHHNNYISQNYAHSLVFLIIGLVLGFLWAKSSSDTNLPSFMPTSNQVSSLVEKAPMESLSNSTTTGDDRVYVWSLPQSRLFPIEGSNDIDLSGNN